MNRQIQGFTVGTVSKKVNWTKQLFSIRISGMFEDYKAGQFVKLALFTDNGELIRRAYSIVNSPKDAREHNELEFLIITDPAGLLSPRLHLLQVGDQVWVSQSAAGFMTLDEIPKSVEQLWLLSTGTAIGPYLAMLMSLETEQRFKKIVLVNATRTQAEQSYLRKIEGFKSKLGEKFIYVPIISRESICGALSEEFQHCWKTAHYFEPQKCSSIQPLRPIQKLVSFIYAVIPRWLKKVAKV